MNFQAKLLKRGEVFKRWRKEARVGGMISGVYFRWNGKDYVNDSVPPEFVNPILNNPMIVVSLATEPVGDAQVVADKPELEEVVVPKVTITPPKVTITPPKKK